MNKLRKPFKRTEQTQTERENKDKRTKQNRNRKKQDRTEQNSGFDRLLFCAIAILLVVLVHATENLYS